MNTRKSKPLAKVFWPVLLLSAALALPADVQAAPSHKARNAHSDKADKNEKEIRQAQKKAQKQVRKQERNAQAQLQRQAELNRQAARQRQLALQRQAEVNRQAELNRQAARQRQLALQRQAELNRQAQLRREAELRRQAQLRQRNQYDDRYYDNNGYYNDGYYDDGYYATQVQRGGTIVVDGYLTNEGNRCQALRDDNGELFMLVGNTYGLRTGDHARVVGRVVDGGHCNWEGTAFEITDVKALWADRRHQAVYYHHNYDGERFGHRNNWMGRRARFFQNRIER